MFLHNFYYPDQKHLDNMLSQQSVLHNALIELAFACRNYSACEKYLAKLRYHHGFNERLKIISGGKIEFTSESKLA